LNVEKLQKQDKERKHRNTKQGYQRQSAEK